MKNERFLTGSPAAMKAAWGLLIFTVVADRIAKQYITRSMAVGDSIPVVEGIFHITYVLNTGAAFSLLAEQRLFFIAVNLLLLAAAAWYYPRLVRQGAAFRYGAALLLGGALGNLVDRIEQGSVIDFFDFRVWPVFNVADIAICVGVGLIMYELLSDENDTDG